MKFLSDAQLPPTLRQLFTEKGYDCIHTSDLDMGNNTPDKVINTISVNEQRILIKKAVISLIVLLSKMNLINLYW